MRRSDQKKEVLGRKEAGEGEGEKDDELTFPVDLSSPNGSYKASQPVPFPSDDPASSVVDPGDS